MFVFRNAGSLSLLSDTWSVTRSGTTATATWRSRADSATWRSAQRRNSRPTLLFTPGRNPSSVRTRSQQASASGCGSYADVWCERAFAVASVRWHWVLPSVCVWLPMLRPDATRDATPGPVLLLVALCVACCLLCVFLAAPMLVEKFQTHCAVHSGPKPFQCKAPSLYKGPLTPRVAQGQRFCYVSLSLGVHTHPPTQHVCYLYSCSRVHAMLPYAMLENSDMFVTSTQTTYLTPMQP